MSFIQSLFKEWFKYLFALVAPLVVILIGGTFVAFGVTSESTILVAIGLFTLGAGILWGIFQFNYHF